MFVQRVCLGTVVFVLFVFFARLIILTRAHVLSKINCHGFFVNTLKSHRNFFRESFLGNYVRLIILTRVHILSKINCHGFLAIR